LINFLTNFLVSPKELEEVRRKHKDITRNSSGDEIANVNFLYDDIVHVGLLENKIDSCINSATDRRGGCVETYVYQIL